MNWKDFFWAEPQDEFGNPVMSYEEQRYQAFKARMAEELLDEHKIMSLLMKDNGVRPETFIKQEKKHG